MMSIGDDVAFSRRKRFVSQRVCYPPDGGRNGQIQVWIPIDSCVIVRTNFSATHTRGRTIYLILVLTYFSEWDLIINQLINEEFPKFEFCYLSGSEKSEMDDL